MGHGDEHGCVGHVSYDHCHHHDHGFHDCDHNNDHFFINLHPTVDCLGICQNYVPRKPEDGLVNPEQMHELDKQIYKQVVNSVERRMEGIERGQYLVDCGDADGSWTFRDKQEKFDDAVAVAVDKRLNEYREATDHVDINGGTASSCECVNKEQ